jgi:hypothetical protein
MLDFRVRIACIQVIRIFTLAIPVLIPIYVLSCTTTGGGLKMIIDRTGITIVAGSLTDDQVIIYTRANIEGITGAIVVGILEGSMTLTISIKYIIDRACIVVIAGGTDFTAMFDDDIIDINEFIIGVYPHCAGATCFGLFQFIPVKAMETS